MSAPVSDRDHDKAGLCQTIRAHTHTAERINGCFDLRARIYIIDDRIQGRRIEIKRFIHHTIEVGHAIRSFHLERFGELVTGGQQPREVALFKRHQLAAVTIHQIRTRDSVHTRIIIDHKGRIVIHADRVEIVARSDLLQTTSIEAHTIQVFVVGILIFLFPVSQEVNDTFGFVHFHDLVYMPGAACDAVLQVTFSVIEVQVRPAVTFAPLDQLLAITYGCQRADFLISIHTFLDNRTDRILSDRIRTDVDTVQVAARTSNEETVIVAQPDTRHLFPITVFLPPRLTCQAQCLIFECRCADFLIAVVVHVEQE